jgi:hypothetical protein
MNADDIRQRKFSDSEKQPKKDKNKTEMINIETSGNAKFIADDKYKLIEDFGTDSEDEEEEEILQQNGKVSNTNVTILPHQIGQAHDMFSRIFRIRIYKFFLPSII